MPTVSSAPSKAGQPEESPRRGQLQPRVQDEAVKQPRVPKAQWVPVQNPLTAREVVSEQEKKKGYQILLKSQNRNFLSKDLNWKILHKCFPKFGTAISHSQSLKGKWPFPLREAPMPLPNGKLTEFHSYSSVQVEQRLKDLSSDTVFFSYLGPLILLLGFNI